MTYDTTNAINFLNGVGTDANGRTVEDYTKFGMDRWEECHDHIQWAFPSHIASDFNPNAPVVDMHELIYGLDHNGKHNVMELYVKYLRSIGIQRTWGGILSLESLENFWLTPHNHNFRRLTRVLNFLSYYNPDYAVELVHLLCNIVETMESNKPVLTVGMVNYWGSPNCIDAKTVVYWVKAALGELK